MASGWTTSGIDWTSAATMRNSRTEDIVREVYIAVNERDYYIRRAKALQLSSDPPIIDLTGRRRLENMTNYIQETVSGWLLPIDDLTDRINLSSYTSLGTLSCFLDEVAPPTGTGVSQDTSSYFYTFTSLDYTENGNFETQYSIDLSLLRTPPKRINLDWTKMIYDILQEDLFFSCSDWRAREFAGGARAYIAFGYTNFVNNYPNEDEYRFYITEQNDAQSVFGDTFQDVEDKMNSNDRLQMFIDPSFRGKLSYTNSTSTGLFMEYDRAYFVFKLKGYAQSFLMSELDNLALSVGTNFQDTLNLLPFSNYEDGISKTRLREETLTQSRIDSALFVQTGIEPGTYHVIEDLITSFDVFNIPSTDQGTTSVSTSVSCFIKINKEDMINYYTEPAP